MNQHSEKQMNEMERYAKMLTGFLHKYRFLIDCYVLDYFVENHWNKIPTPWQNILEKMETKDIARFLDSKQSPRLIEVWPLTLLAFRATTFALAAPRQAINSTLPIENFINQSSGKESSESGTYFWDPTDFSSGRQINKNLPETCRKHVKPKKQHEIYRLSQVIDVVLKKEHVSNVVDVGSGLGHLSRLLSLQYNLNVLAIESISSLTSSASSFDKQALTSLEKKKDKETVQVDGGILISQNIEFIKLPKHFEGHIPNDCYEYFNEVVQEAWGNKGCNNVGNENFAMLGLHACGDLSASIIKLFIGQPKAKVLFSVGCCYMKLNSDDNKCGYPLSKTVKALPLHFLSYEARELSCHAIEKYQSRLKENSISLKIHCFRALLEKIINKYYPSLRHLGLKSVRSVEATKFSEYASNALCKHKLAIPEEEFTSPETELCVQEWKKVVLLYSLRLLTAPVIESLILIDRMLYLSENGCYCCIFPIFEPIVSPRNHLVIAFKNNIL